jgi:clan AA aspartic protease
MKGKVNARCEATLQFRLRGRRRRWRKVLAVVDTGYSGMLTLPRKTIAALALRRIGRSDAKLADGSVATFDVYAALLEWEGRTIPIYVDEAAADPLIGMGLLQGHDLAMRVKAGGKVSVVRF